MKLDIVSCKIQQTKNSWSTEWFLDLIVGSFRKNLSVHATREQAERAKQRWLMQNGKPV